MTIYVCQTCDREFHAEDPHYCPYCKSQKVAQTQDQCDRGSGC